MRPPDAGQEHLAALHEHVRRAELAAVAGAALTRRGSLEAQLQQCAEAIVSYLDVAFARIWTLDATEDMLLLQASAGLYTHRDGPHSRVPVGALKIGRIAWSRTPHLTNDVPRDPEIGDKEWARREGMVAFAGYPLMVEERVVGVLALFARRPLGEETLTTLSSLAFTVALGIDRATADAERADLLIREQAALAAATAERSRLESLLMQAPAVICFLTGPDHVFTLANSRYLDLVAHREVMGKPVREALPEPAARDFCDQLDEVYRTGEPLLGTEVATLLDRAGTGVLEEAFFNFIYQPTHDAAGAVDGILVHAVEVTEQVRARSRIDELALATTAERDRLRQVLDVMPEGVMIADARGEWVLSNRTARRLLVRDAAAEGSTEAEAITHRAWETRRLDGTRYLRDDMPIHRSLQQGEIISGEQVLLRDLATGNDLPLLVNSAPLRDAAGALMGAVTAFQDISPIKDAERQKDEFLAAVSHDLKNPLAAILGQGQLLLRRARRLSGDDAERLLGGLESLTRTAGRMVAQIDELLDLSQLQMGRALDLDLAPVDLVTLVTRMISEYQLSTDQHSLELTTPPDPLVCVCDAGRIERVVGNLLSNAVKYSPEGGRIILTLATAQQDARPWGILSVADQGIGIPPADLPRIFDRFYRGSNAAGHYSGTGLGLTGARQIVEQHGGRITLTSTGGAGTTVTVFLPLEAPRQPAAGFAGAEP